MFRTAGLIFTVEEKDLSERYAATLVIFILEIITTLVSPRYHNTMQVSTEISKQSDHNETVPAGCQKK